MNQGLINDLREGRCAVKNDGALGQLKKVLSIAFPNDNVLPEGRYEYYFKRVGYNGEWTSNHDTDLASYSVNDFLINKS